MAAMTIFLEILDFGAPCVDYDDGSGKIMCSATGSTGTNDGSCVTSPLKAPCAFLLTMPQSTDCYVTLLSLLTSENTPVPQSTHDFSVFRLRFLSLPIDVQPVDFEGSSVYCTPKPDNDDNNNNNEGSRRLHVPRVMSSGSYFQTFEKY